MHFSSNTIRNGVSGFLAGYAGFTVLSLMLLEGYWGRAIQTAPVPSLGIVYFHKGASAVGYYSAFQTTSVTLLFAIPIAAGLLAALIAPRKKQIKYDGGPALPRFIVGLDDPLKVQRWAAPIGAVISLPLNMGLGPHLVTWLNHGGHVFTM